MPTGAFPGARAEEYNRMQALKGWPPPEEESPKGIRRLIRQWLLVPVKWKRPARQRRGLFACAGGLGAGWRGLEEKLWPRCRVWSSSQRLKARGSGRRISARSAPRGEAEGVVCPSGVIGGVGSRSWGTAAGHRSGRNKLCGLSDGGQRIPPLMPSKPFPARNSLPPPKSVRI